MAQRDYDHHRQIHRVPAIQRRRVRNIGEPTGRFAAGMNRLGQSGSKKIRQDSVISNGNRPIDGNRSQVTRWNIATTAKAANLVRRLDSHRTIVKIEEGADPGRYEGCCRNCQQRPDQREGRPGKGATSPAARRAPASPN